MKNCLAAGTVKDLRQEFTVNWDAERLTSLFHSKFGSLPATNEVESWLRSLPIVLNIMGKYGLGEAQCLIEYMLPFDFGRCDLLVIGKCDERLTICVVELKQWTKVTPFSPNTDIVEAAGVGAVSHPSYQVLNYAGKIQRFHSVGATADITSCVFMHNLNSSDESARFLASGNFEQLVAQAPIFFEDQDAELCKFLHANIAFLNAGKGDLESFSEGHYTQSRQLFDGISKHARDISEMATTSVINAGWGLSDVQLIVKEDLKKSLAEDKRIVYLVKGEPGSGKTLVAVYLLFELLKSRRPMVLSFRNSRLMAILRRCFDKAMPGTSGLLKYLGDARDPKKGLVNSKETFDLVIVDEAQRIKQEDIQKLFERSNIFLLLYDEFQMLVPYESGSRTNYLTSAKEAGFEIKEYELTAAARCKGGKPYQDWVDTLLSSGAPDALQSGATWKDRYDFRVFPTLQEMISELGRLHRTTGTDVCVLASFTESDGRESRIRTRDPQLLWAMDEAHYTKFWLARESNKLDQCASVYGCQGFERYFAGVIWGRDYCRRNGKWSVPTDHTITDNIGSRGNRLLDLAKKRDPRALQLLFNRYRIMLTRGIFGTFIYVEDEETRLYLQEITKKIS